MGHQRPPPWIPSDGIKPCNKVPHRTVQVLSSLTHAKADHDYARAAALQKEVATVPVNQTYHCSHPHMYVCPISWGCKTLFSTYYHAHSAEGTLHFVGATGSACARVCSTLGRDFSPYLWEGPVVHNPPIYIVYGNFILQRQSVDSGEPCLLLHMDILCGGHLQAALWLWPSFETMLLLLQGHMLPALCARCAARSLTFGAHECFALAWQIMMTPALRPARNRNEITSTGTIQLLVHVG